MAGFTNYLEDKIMNHVFGGISYDTAPATCYCALFTVGPTEGGGGTEVSDLNGGAYVRQPCSWTIEGSGTAEARTSAALEWAAATTDWGTVTHAGIFDALTGGNLLAFRELTKADFTTANPKTVNSGDIFKIAAGNLKLQLD